MLNVADKPKLSDLDKGSIPLPDSVEDSQDGVGSSSAAAPTSASQMNTLLASASAMLGGMANSSDGKQQDAGAMAAALNAAAAASGQGSSGIPGMPNTTFGIPRKFSILFLLRCFVCKLLFQKVRLFKNKQCMFNL